MVAKKTTTRTRTRARTKAAVTSKTRVAKSKMKRSELVRKEITTCFSTIDESYINVAKLLNEAYHKEFFIEWGFEKFEDYCKTDLDIHYRKAMYYVDIIDTVKKFDLNLKDVEAMGWTKMREICSVINEKNAAEWMKKAKGMSAREVVEAVKTVRRSDVNNADVPSITTMTFRMNEGEAGIILDALDEAKKLCETENAVVGLGMICQDWSESHAVAPKRANLETHVAFLEQQYGVKISWGADADKAETAKASKEKVKKDVVKEATARHDAKVNGDGGGDVDIDELLDDLDGEPEPDDGGGDDLNRALGL